MSTAGLVAPPSPMWFVARAAGMVTLVLLCATVCAGLLLPRRGPGNSAMFVLDEVHRFLVLLFFSFLAVHVGTVVVDPFTRFRLADVLVPFGSDYRRTWMGLGIVSAEIGVALALSVHLRRRVGYRIWRSLHFGTYVMVPLALLHGLGTGTDTHSGLHLAIYAACGAAVSVALATRLVRSGMASQWATHGGVAAIAVAVVTISVWAMRGPLGPGWSRAAGTPQHTQSVVTRLAPSTSTAHAMVPQ